MKRIFFSLILIGFYAGLFSQTDGDDSLQKGQVNIYQDARLDSLLSISKYINEADPHIDGFRIEIFFESGNNSHSLALEKKGVFVQNHIGVPVYITFQAPNYKVRVGDFRTSLEAEKYLQQIKGEYPGAWVVADRIKFPIVKTDRDE